MKGLWIIILLGELSRDVINIFSYIVCIVLRYSSGFLLLPSWLKSWPQEYISAKRRLLKKNQLWRFINLSCPCLYLYQERRTSNCLGIYFLKTRKGSRSTWRGSVFFSSSWGAKTERDIHALYGSVEFLERTLGTHERTNLVSLPVTKWRMKYFMVAHNSFQHFSVLLLW